MKTLKPKLCSAACITKIEKPVLTKDDIPYEASLIFNAGVAKYNGKYVMVFRNDYGPTEETFPEVRFKTSGVTCASIPAATTSAGKRMNSSVLEIRMMHSIRGRASGVFLAPLCIRMILPGVSFAVILSTICCGVGLSSPESHR